jgi:tRNA1(Val) A37 N6-methylase TrmN6
MARRSSQAVAGFYPTPPHYMPTIAAILAPEHRHLYHGLRVVDPCAGEGAALVALRDGLAASVEKVTTFAAEMERTRWQKLRESDPRRQATYLSPLHVHGDFFHVRWEPGFADVLFANPPYDTDKRFKRLEARFLDHAAPMLANTGVLVFVVPHYALSACASTSAKHFSDLRCFRFIGDDFAVFKQVLLFARKTTRSAPDPEVFRQCEAWSADATIIPEFEIRPPEYAPFFRYAAYTRGRDHGDSTWEMTHFDVSAVATLDPFESERGPIPDLCPHLDLSSRIGAVYPIVSPPRPVHLAAALAAGVFNGLHVQSNDGSLPDLLVKGTFKRRWDTVDQKHNSDGELTSETQVERPELEVWVLDLSTGAYHCLVSSPDTTDNLTSIAGATFADLLTHYSKALLSALRAACPVLHDPVRGDEEPPVEGLGRPLWRAQNSTLHAANKLADKGNGVLIVGEVGTGKTGITAALLRLRNIRRALIQVPPHLLSSWRNQIEMVIPGTAVVELRAISDVIALRAHPGQVIALLSREASKLGHGWRALPRRVDPVSGFDAKHISCPKCGAIVPDANSSACYRRRGRPGPLAARQPLPAAALQPAAQRPSKPPAGDGRRRALHGLGEEGGAAERLTSARSRRRS